MSETSSKQLRVLLATPSHHGQGGVAIFFNNILPWFKDSEFRINVVEIGSSCERRTVLSPLTDQIRFFIELRKKPDLVHINPSLAWKSFFRDGLFAWQAKRKGLPVLIFFHGWNKKFEIIVGSYLHWFFKRTFCKGDRFIVLASDFRQKLLEWGVCVPVKIGTTAFDVQLLDGFHYEEKLFDIPVKQKLRILFLARLACQKGIYETIEAVKALIDKGMPLSLSIAGEGPLTQELEEYIEKLCLPHGSIVLLGYVRGKLKARAFAEHDIYCLPSYGEGLPVSVLEAMAFALPVITTSVGGLADFFENDKMGFLVRRKAAGEIALCVERLFYDREKMVQIAKYNYSYARKYFVAPRVASYLRDAYRSILTSK